MHNESKHRLDSPDDKTIAAILKSAQVIAVVGLSDKPDRPSYRVAAYLQKQGYEIVPVNPRVSEVLGQKAYDQLTDVDRKIDVVDIFRRSEAVGEIVEQAIAIGAKTIWMQEGIINHPAATTARSAGLTVVMNKCLLKEHLRIQG